MGSMLKALRRRIESEAAVDGRIEARIAEGDARPVKGHRGRKYLVVHRIRNGRKPGQSSRAAGVSLLAQASHPGAIAQWRARRVKESMGALARSADAASTGLERMASAAERMAGATRTLAAQIQEA